LRHERLGCKAEDAGVRIKACGSKLEGRGSRVEGVRFGVQGSGFRVQGEGSPDEMLDLSRNRFAWCRIHGEGLRVQNFQVSGDNSHF